MNYEIRELDVSLYEDVYELWQRTENLGLSTADTREGIAAYLKRNPGLSLVALSDGVVVGSVLGGHDGRRGYLYHLAVDSGHRKAGIGRKLVELAADKLAKAGIKKCHTMVYRHNRTGKGIWCRLGWSLREDLDLMSVDTDRGHK